MQGLIPEAFIAPGHAVVGNQRPMCYSASALRLAARIRRIERAEHGAGHAGQEFLFAAGAMGLRVDDDLVLSIDGCYTTVALDYAFACRHLRAVFVCNIGEAHATMLAGTFPVLGIVLESGAQIGRLLRNFARRSAALVSSVASTCVLASRSLTRWRSIILHAASSSLAACFSNSARVPLLALVALKVLTRQKISEHTQRPSP